MQTCSFWGYSPGPVFYSAISALDTALWDIKGKIARQPIYELLGGPCRNRIRAYASQVQFGWGAGVGKQLARPEEYFDETKRIMAEGYGCVKVNPIRYDAEGNFIPAIKGKLPSSIVRAMASRVEAVRDAGSEDLDILVEFNSRCSTEATIQIARAMKGLNCMYLEEPIHFMEPGVVRHLTTRVAIPLAGGERLYTRWQFLPYLKDRLISLAQPDVGLAGGITEVKKICDLAHIFDVQMQMHVCGSPVAATASLHLAAAVVNCTLYEHHVHLLKPGNREVVLSDYKPVKGYFSLPDGPGLGIEPNVEYLNRSPKKIVGRV
jgi:L-alanine-DL-glutamate epimerase-like enolase superfamily enzyme